MGGRADVVSDHPWNHQKMVFGLLQTSRINPIENLALSACSPQRAVNH